MTTTAELKRLIELSVADPRQEPAVLRALLDARLYVHLPLSDDSPMLRLVCFTRPDGLTVIPVFTDVDKANAAAQGAVRIGTVRGRELFISAPGATFMLDPNDVSTTLYPEEVAALLASNEAAIAPTVIAHEPIGISPARPEDRWVGALVAGAVRGIATVDRVYLFQAHIGGSVEPTGLLAVVAVPVAGAERAARAAALALKKSERVPRLEIDLTTFDPADPPEWVEQEVFVPVWSRNARQAR